MKSYRVKHKSLGPGVVFGQSWDSLSEVTDLQTMKKEIKRLKKAGVHPDSLTIKFDTGLIAAVRSEDVEVKPKPQ